MMTDRVLAGPDRRHYYADYTELEMQAIRLGNKGGRNHFADPPSEQKDELLAAVVSRWRSERSDLVRRAYDACRRWLTVSRGLVAHQAKAYGLWSSQAPDYYSDLHAHWRKLEIDAWQCEDAIRGFYGAESNEHGENAEVAKRMRRTICRVAGDLPPDAVDARLQDRIYAWRREAAS